MKIGVLTTVEVDIKSIYVHIKTRDSISGSLKDEKGDDIVSFDDQYTPSFFPGEHWGDYLILDIDLETGVIKNWKKPTEEKLREFYEKIKEE